ncbi:MAG TPA: heme ABC exporter ATP-binding protein CcmA [Chloroflexota bacterium]|nr:heme ABC exporter ATP-binding protein CcmA [Chloroflexota bacterium]
MVRAAPSGLDRLAPDGSSGSAPPIEARGLRVTFGDQAVLRGLDLVVGAGTRLAVLGPNGSGKTTLIRALGGLLRPTGGRILIEGQAYSSGGAAIRRSIGLVSHQGYLYPELTVWENLRFYAKLYRVPEWEDRAREVLKRMGLYQRRAERAASLSRGMAQRLTLARALLHDPSILLLDEPDTGLDARAFATLEALLREVERTVVLTTHDLDHALRLADEIAVLHGGHLVDRVPSAHLDPTALRDRYAAATLPRGEPAEV